MTDKTKNTPLKTKITGFILLFLSFFFLYFYFFGPKDLYYDYSFPHGDYIKPSLNLIYVPEDMQNIANSSFDALLEACPGLKAAFTRGEKFGVLYFKEGLRGSDELKDVSFLFEADIPEDVFSEFPKGFHDPQWGNHIMYRIDLVSRGVWMDWPTDIWLCHEPLFENKAMNEDFIMGYDRTWHQYNVFKSIPTLPKIPYSPSSLRRPITKHK